MTNGKKYNKASVTKGSTIQELENLIDAEVDELKSAFKNLLKKAL